MWVGQPVFQDGERQNELWITLQTEFGLVSNLVISKDLFLDTRHWCRWRLDWSGNTKSWLYKKSIWTDANFNHGICSTCMVYMWFLFTSYNIPYILWNFLPNCQVFFTWFHDVLFANCNYLSKNISNISFMCLSVLCARLLHI